MLTVKLVGFDKIMLVVEPGLEHAPLKPHNLSAISLGNLIITCLSFLDDGGVIASLAHLD